MHLFRYKDPKEFTYSCGFPTSGHVTPENAEISVKKLPLRLKASCGCGWVIIRHRRFLTVLFESFGVLLIFDPLTLTWDPPGGPDPSLGVYTPGTDTEGLFQVTVTVFQLIDPFVLIYNHFMQKSAAH